LNPLLGLAGEFDRELECEGCRIMDDILWLYLDFGQSIGGIVDLKTSDASMMANNGRDGH
jgi:hypothetical protein